MKLSIAFLFILFSVYEARSQQTSANVSTPKGSTVTAWTVTENTSYWRGYYNAYWATSNRTYHTAIGGELDM